MSNEKVRTVDTAKKILSDWNAGKAWMVVDNPILYYESKLHDTVVLTNLDHPYGVLSRAGGEREVLRDKKRALYILNNTCVKCYIYDKDDDESKYLMELAPAELANLVEEIGID